MVHVTAKRNMLKTNNNLHISYELNEMELYGLSLRYEVIAMK